MNAVTHIASKKNMAAWLVLLLSLLFALGGWYLLSNQVQKNRQQQFDVLEQQMFQAIQKRLHQHELILLGGLGLFQASSSVEREEWRDYIQSLSLAQHYPGILGVGFSEMVAPDALATHIEQIRRQGFPEFTVKPAGERKIYSSIIYLEPFSGRNLAAFGYDMFSEPTRRKAMTLAAETGRTAISSKVTLVQETHGKQQAGFLMYIPVYKKGMPLTSLQQRWQALQGFVYSPYRMDDLMAGIMGSGSQPLDFVIYDGVQLLDKHLMYDSREFNENVESVALQGRKKLSRYGHDWTVVFYSTPQFDAQHRRVLPEALLMAGICISLLLFFLVMTLSLRRQRAEALALKMTKDIREQQQQLYEHKSQLQGILDGAEHLIVSTDTQGIIRSLNRSAQQYLGYREDELAGKQTPAIFHEPQEVLARAEELNIAPGFEVFVCKVQQPGSSETRRWTFIHKDGSHFPVLLTVTAIRDQQQQITAYMGIASDISERDKVERMKKEFISTVSHELRTPLTAMNGSLRLMHSGAFGEVPEQMHELLKIAEQNGKRLLWLVNDLLDMEKIESGAMSYELQCCAVADLLQQAVTENLEFAAQFGVNYRLPEVLPPLYIRVDKIRFLQVLANLLSNAAKFSPENETVTLHYYADAQQIKIAVSNPGKGIPESYRPMIFQKFSQLDSSDSRLKPGTGLGLAISKSMVEQMGGRIDFESEENGLTTFYVCFPQIDEAE